MKRPQRDFVVEIKSSRRLAKSKSNSIWGSVDLKAHAAHVEEQLRADNDGPAMLASIDAQQKEPAAESALADVGEVIKAGIGGNSQMVATSAEEAPLENHADDHRDFRAAIGDVEHKMTSTKAERKGGVSLEPSKTNLKKISAGSHRRPAGISRNVRKSEPASKSSLGRDAIRDLVELEAENKQLKKLLADRLRKENAELRRKLGFS